MSNSNTISTLDTIKNQKGRDELKEYFIQSLTEDENKATELIDDDNTSFTSLFILKDTLENSQIANKINERKKLALVLTKEILTGERNFSIISESSFSHIQSIYSTLRWIVESGYLDDGIDDDYDEVLDKASILLLNVYNDKTLIPIILEMIFKRYANNLFIHDLVWAYFKTYDLDSLKLIAKRLLSPNEKEIELAKKLLNFIPETPNREKVDNEKQYLYSMNWLIENSPYLFASGESYQQKSNPMFYRLNKDAKYLCKYINVKTGKFLTPLTKEENKLLNEFANLDEDIKILLSDASLKIHNENLSKWNLWLSSSLDRKVKIAYRLLGGVK